MTFDELNALVEAQENVVDDAEQALEDAERDLEDTRFELRRAEARRDNARANMHLERRQRDILRLALVGIEHS
jgi:outer membrane protein TolC